MLAMRCREGSQSSNTQPPGGLDTHSLDYYMRAVADRDFNTLRIAFNHGTHPCQPSWLCLFECGISLAADGVLQNEQIDSTWGSMFAPELHQKHYLEMFQLVAKAAAKRGLFVIMAAHQLTAGMDWGMHQV